MPRYFLDACNAEILSSDPQGRDLPNLDAARREAIAGIRSILARETAEGKLDLRGEIRIRNERGHVVRVVPFCDALEIRI